MSVQTGTEPGDFIELDMDLVEADRRQRLRDALRRVLGPLSDEIGVDLRIDNDGNDLVLSDAEGVRFRASIAVDGRLVVTDQRRSELL